MPNYNKQVWENGPAAGTPLSAGRLNIIEDGLDAADAAIDTHIIAAAPHSGHEPSGSVAAHVAALSHPQLTVFDVRAYGAVAGGAAGSAKTAVLAAINAAKVAGGTVFFPNGTWQLGDLAITLPEYTEYKHVNLLGAGRENTILNFSVDRGAGTYAINGNVVSANALFFSIISDMRVVGPSAVAAMGVTPANMHGIGWASRIILERVDVVGFKGGIVSIGNHSTMRDCTSANNYYGIYFGPETQFSAGDIVVDACDLSGNKMASIGISPNGIATLCMIKGHLGFCPYGIYIETGGWLGGLSLGGTIFQGTSWEYLGNGAIYSEGQTGRVSGLIMQQCGNYSRNFATYGIAARTVNPLIYLGELMNCQIDSGCPVQGPADGPCFDILGYTQMTIKGDWTLSFATSNANGQPWILSSDLLARIRLEEFSTIAFAAQRDMVLNASILLGHVLEYQTNANIAVRPFGSYAYKGRLAGVAANAVSSADSSRRCVIVIQHSEGNTSVKFDATGAAQSNIAVASNVLTGHATAISYDGTNLGGRQIIGDSWFGFLPITAISAGVKVNIGG